jgi:hypothetical protein
MLLTITNNKKINKLFIKVSKQLIINVVILIKLNGHRLLFKQ